MKIAVPGEKWPKTKVTSKPTASTLGSCDWCVHDTLKTPPLTAVPDYGPLWYSGDMSEMKHQRLPCSGRAKEKCTRA